MSFNEPFLIRKTAILCAALVIAASALFTGSASATFPGENGKIVYLQSYLDYGHTRTRLLTIQANGSHKHDVIKGTYGDPSFSSTGHRILVPGAKTRLVRANGNRVVIVPGSQRLFSPTLSPNGKTIAYFDGNYVLRTMHIDGSHKHVITRKIGVGAGLTFSPSGHTLVFYGRQGIYKAALSNGKVQTVYNPPGDAAAIQPDVSPNGKRIVFQFSYSPDEEIWTVGIDGKNPHPMVTSAFAALRAENPVFSPDGTRIAFEAHIGGTNGAAGHLKLMTADSKTGKQRRVIGGTSSAYSPTWGPRT